MVRDDTQTGVSAQEFVIDNRRNIRRETPCHHAKPLRCDKSVRSGVIEPPPTIGVTPCVPVKPVIETEKLPRVARARDIDARLKPVALAPIVFSPRARGIAVRAHVMEETRFCLAMADWTRRAPTRQTREKTDRANLSEVVTRALETPATRATNHSRNLQRLRLEARWTTTRNDARHFSQRCE